MLERLVFTPRSGAEKDAVAAILLLRARAAKTPKVQVGLFWHLRCLPHERSFSGFGSEI
ncbi:hypothetical protein J4729_14485 [Leisingera sp. HS039]|uniref:hypothetical protein n=1 Tax=Leisingera sp. HS039 TaxID=2818496 RepID=UPI001B3A70AF|nr:hypothetical protein [Leisingera sp. HS039]MBQ4825747.1 hypothetical protein [Leisingera sp. HS039]